MKAQRVRYAGSTPPDDLRAYHQFLFPNECLLIARGYYGGVYARFVPREEKFRLVLEEVELPETLFEAAKKYAQTQTEFDGEFFVWNKANEK